MSWNAVSVVIIVVVLAAWLAHVEDGVQRAQDHSSELEARVEDLEGEVEALRELLPEPPAPPAPRADRRVSRQVWRSWSKKYAGRTPKDGDA